MRNKEYHFKYCYVYITHGCANVICTHDLKTIAVRNDWKLIYDVTFLVEDGMLYIKGMEDTCYYEQFATPLSELEESPQPQYIKVKTKNIFGKKLKTPECYVKGWYRTIPIHKVQLCLKHWNLKVYE